MEFLTIYFVLINMGICTGSVTLLTATPLVQTFTSHVGYDGTTPYPEGNYTKDWYITTNWINHTIEIKIAACNIESSKHICLFDYLYVYDGPDSNSTEMLKTCCDPLGTSTFISSNGEMYILFETDNTKSEAGFEIEYSSHGITTTTTTTTISPPSTDSSSTIQTPSASVSPTTPDTSSDISTYNSTLSNAPISTQTHRSDATTISGAHTIANSMPAEGKDNTMYIIIACVVTLILLLAVIALIVVVCIKKHKNSTTYPQPFLVHDGNGIHPDSKNIKFAGRQMGLPVPRTPPINTVMNQAETNLFDLELPDKEKGRANLLPPLYSKTIDTSNSN